MVRPLIRPLVSGSLGVGVTLALFCFSAFTLGGSSPAPVLVQRHARSITSQQAEQSSGTRDVVESEGRRSCAELKNHGTYFTVPLRVGVPRQTFHVVADTGSDAVIIPSCVCGQSGECPSNDACYRGQSSMLAIQRGDVPLVDMEFGSGSIKAAITTAQVRVGRTVASVKDGLLLMVGRHLDITGDFEGILGLGQLQSEYSKQLEEIAAQDHPAWDFSARAIESRKQGNFSAEHGEDVYIPGFLRAAKVARFSLCFNDGGADPGVLRFGMPQPTGIPSVGTLHWGLNLLGFAVGPTQVPAIICGSGASTGAAYAEPAECGAIPDSGTTVMLGPEAHVQALLRGICDDWPRCAAAAGPGGEYAGKHGDEVFQLLLANCEEWLHHGNGSLDELPVLHMHLGSAEKNRTLEISPWSYIFETPTAEIEAHSQLLGNLALSFASFVGAARSPSEFSCASAFGTSSYATEDVPDPVWVVGMPVFYEYVVGFNLGTPRPEISFSSEECGSCADDRAATSRTRNVALAAGGRGRRSRGRLPRRVQGVPRVGAKWRRKRRGEHKRRKAERTPAQ
eukprot:TRINITY_DN63828_c0_g1_i1.p1 TRINITY_DN63828_c0_g1~~TRINITY_DN63828_c0_g1_i1.p1  ORF type:complete len:565 (-),score=108.01 TRINITY_DN63828_c0_g1_i1:53-1747(-)